MTGAWSLRYPGVNVKFTDESGIFLREYPDIGDSDRSNDDGAIPRGDGTKFGSDFIGGRTITLSFGTEGKTPEDVQARYEQLAGMWRADVVRKTAGAIAELVSDSGRSAFGRPRRLAPSAFRQFHSPPQIDIEADFQQADDLWYGAEQSMTVGLIPPATGGLMAPLRTPLSTTASSDRSQVFDVDGTIGTWSIIEINGPITNPSVEVVGVFKLQYLITLLAGQRLVIDTRPWVRSVLLGRGSRGGSASRLSSRLSQTLIPSGRQEVVLRGSSAGNPTARIRWRPAFPTP